MKTKFLPLLSLLCPATALAQQTPVTGLVTEEDKPNPLRGVYVAIKGTKTATLTNAQGRYSIKASPGDTLVFTYVGMANQELVVGSSRQLNVQLARLGNGLDDVVVIGYGTVRRKDATGALGEVNIEDLRLAPVSSFDKALAGRIAGVAVASNDDQPGSELNIVIRGANSLTQSNQPLYVIDGFPVEDFSNSSLNPEDIASITILKDASATAIYGARGANGVIVIELKKGKAGKSVISYKGSAGFTQTTRNMEMMSPFEFVRYQLDRYGAAAQNTYLSGGKTLDSYRNVEGIDWQAKSFRPAFMTEHNLQISGGSNQTKFSLTGSVFQQEGVVLNSGFNRYQGRASVDHNVNAKLKVGLNANYSFQKAFGQLANQQGGGGQATSFLMYSIWGYRPVTGNDSVQLDDLLFDPDLDITGDFRINPVLGLNNELRENLTKTLLANAYAQYNLRKNLVLRITGGLNNRAVQTNQFFNSNTSRGTTLIPTNVRGVNGSVSTLDRTDWVNENTLSWNQRFNSNHQLDVVGGFTMQGTRTQNFGFATQNVPNEQLGLSGLDEGIPYSTTAFKSSNTLVSFLGRANYNLLNRYLFTATMRADASSRFAPNQRWGYFPSGAVAWRVSQEKFLKNARWLSDLKLRAGFGVTGNNRVSDFAYLSSLQLPIAASYSFNNGTPQLGVIPNDLGNPNLRWELTHQADLGLELGLFQNRVNLTVDVYRKTTRDLLLNANLPATTGFQSAFKNVGRIRNDGLEITLETKNITTKNFRWTTNFNIGFNQNKVIQLADNEEQIFNNVTWTTNYNAAFLYVAQLGQPAAQFWGYTFDGIYQFSDFDDLGGGNFVLKADRPGNGSARAGIRPGDIRYKDLNGDLLINSADLGVIGNAIPRHTGGFTNNFQYKNFELNVFFQWSYGNDIFNANRIYFEGDANSRQNLNQFASYANRWTPDNPSNTLFRAGGQGIVGIYSSRILEDGSYLRLKTLNLGYNLPASLVKRLRITNFNVFASAQNLLTFTNYTGQDPEVSTRNTALTPGFDYSAYPRGRSYVFGLRTTF